MLLFAASGPPGVSLRKSKSLGGSCKNSSKMSTQNTATGQTVEQLKAALSRAKFSRLQAEVAVAKAASALVSAEVDVKTAQHVVESLEADICAAVTSAEGIPPEPFRDFVLAHGIGPCRVSADVLELATTALLCDGGVVVQVKGVPTGWMVLLVGRPEAPMDDFCYISESWSDAVRHAREIFAKWSAPLAVAA